MLQILCETSLVVGGGLLQIIYFGLSWIWTRRIIDQTEPLAIEQLVRIEAIMNRILSEKSAPQYATSETVQVPLDYGLFNPVIVLPRRMLEASDEVALGHGLAHEWAHLVVGQRYFGGRINDPTVFSLLRTLGPHQGM